MAAFVRKVVGTVVSPVNETETTPTISEFYAGMTTLQIVLLWIASIASCIVFLIAILQIFYVIMYVKKENLRSHIYFLIFMPPVTCICSMIGMFIPRSAAFVYTVNISYFMLCLYMVITLMFAMFGSKRILVKYLQENTVPIRLAVPPWFTCMTFLPEFEGTRRNVTIIESLILQTLIIRMVQQVVEMVVFHELGDRNHIFFSISNFIGLISMLLAFAFVYVMIDLGKERLAPYKYSIMFRLHDAAQTMCSVQKFGADILVKLGIIEKNGVLPPSCAAMFFLNFALCIEMMLLSCLALYLLRPSQTILFESEEDSAAEKNPFPFGLSTSVEQKEFLDQHSDGNMKPSPQVPVTKSNEKTSMEAMTAMPITPMGQAPEHQARKRLSSQEYAPLPKSDPKTSQT